MTKKSSDDKKRDDVLKKMLATPPKPKPLSKKTKESKPKKNI